MLRLLITAAAIATGPSPDAVPDISPSVSLETAPAERFAALWQARDGGLDETVLRRDYLDTDTRAFELFELARGLDAAMLATRIATERSLYDDAVDRCLPWALEATPLLRSTYRSLQELLPDVTLPRATLIIGAGNLGGTAAPDRQVIALEVVCRASPDKAAFNKNLSAYFAHEAVHSLQAPFLFPSNVLLHQVMREGVADYIAGMIIGRSTDPDRDAWAGANQEQVWQAFSRSVRDIEGFRPNDDRVEQRMELIRLRWLAGSDLLFDDQPGSLGYWVGAQIAADYVERSDDPSAAIRELVFMIDSRAILAATRYEDILLLER